MDADEDADPTYSYDLVTIKGTRVTRRTVEYALEEIDGELFDDDEEDEEEDGDGSLLDTLWEKLNGSPRP
jgi:hypothetical protein